MLISSYRSSRLTNLSQLCRATESSVTAEHILLANGYREVHRWQYNNTQLVAVSSTSEDLPSSCRSDGWEIRSLLTTVVQLRSLSASALATA